MRSPQLISSRSTSTEINKRQTLLFPPMLPTSRRKSTTSSCDSLRNRSLVEGSARKRSDRLRSPLQISQPTMISFLSSSSRVPEAVARRTTWRWYRTQKRSRNPYRPQQTRCHNESSAVGKLGSRHDTGPQASGHSRTSQSHHHRKKATTISLPVGPVYTVLRTPRQYGVPPNSCIRHLELRPNSRTCHGNDRPRSDDTRIVRYGLCG